MRLDNILGNVLDALTGRDQQQGQNADGYPADVQPASQDPFGDPADGGQGTSANYPGDVLPASQDPYGDPADEMSGQDVLPASQDPYGDPADSRR